MWFSLITCAKYFVQNHFVITQSVNITKQNNSIKNLGGNAYGVEIIFASDIWKNNSYENFWQ